MARDAVFVAIEFEVRQRWIVKANTLAAGPGRAVSDAVNDAVRAAITRLVHNHEADPDAYKGPIYFMMHGVRSEQRARELAAALHGDLETPGPCRPSPTPTMTRTQSPRATPLTRVQLTG
ncbi:hypothetical protein ACIO93_43720 [Streptomyces sp. NPDC087903]|uniref:hypothetical protein n=1 Tax=Streptomyces sp. NPDC087903 TaxID=3365819 RepID=UPI0037F2768B